MDKLSFVTMEDSILRKKCVKVSLSELQSEECQSVIDSMIALIGNDNGGMGKNRNKTRSAGLAANQVGIAKQIIVIDMAFGKSDAKDMMALINPKVLSHSSAMKKDRETCLSLVHGGGKIAGLIKRWKSVKVRGIDRYGTQIDIHASDLLARLLQHEIDHLSGVIFIDHLQDPMKAHFIPKGQADKYRRDFRVWKNFVDVTPWVRNCNLN